MFYAVQKVESHPCFDMQELVYSVFYFSIQGIQFGKDVFPNRFTGTNRAWVNLKGIRNSFEALYELLLTKSIDRRKGIYSQLVDNNMIELLCENPNINPENYLELDSDIGMRIKEVIESCYKKLDLSHFRVTDCKLKPTHRYYREYIAINNSVCPFCSINTYKNPLNPRREDFDHYLPKALYPLAAANMYNLVPMCNECNQDFKSVQDPIYDGSHRVTAFYPFSTVAGVTVEVESSVELVSPFERKWLVKLVPNDVEETEKVFNWNRVFSIESRLVNELTQRHDEWVRQVLDPKAGEVIETVNEFRAYMMEQAEIEKMRADRRNEPNAILKASFYGYMYESADDHFIKSYMQEHNALI